MEQYKDEKAFLKTENIEYDHTARVQEYQTYELKHINLTDLLSKHKVHLIEQAKKGKLTLQECKEIVITDTKYLNWTGVLRDLDLSPDKLNDFIDSAAEMYAMQFLPSAPAEQWISSDITPPIGIKVQIYCDVLGHTTGFYWGNTGKGLTNGWSIMGVTHWMPLPPAPESTTSTKQP